MYNVITRLIQECDRVVKSTLESFEEERTMRRKVSFFLDPTNNRTSTNVVVQALRYRCTNLASTQRTVFCGIETTNDH